MTSRFEFGVISDFVLTGFYAVVMQFLSLGAVLLLPFASVRADADGATICQNLLNSGLPSIANQRIVGEETKFYPRSQFEQEPYILSVCAPGCLAYVKSDSPFSTQNAVQGTEQVDADGSTHVLQGSSEKAILVVDSTGILFGNTRRIEGRSHHSTAVAGQNVYFAGEVTTNEHGQILELDYQSGHYPHGPYYMKLLIDDLGGPEALAQVRVRLSDTAAEVRSYGHLQPRMTVPEFYRYCLKPSDTGDDVLINYIYFTKASSTLDLWDFIEPTTVQVFRLLGKQAAIQRFLQENKSSPETRARLLRQMVNWVYLLYRSEVGGRVQTGIRLSEDLWTSSGNLEFKREFYKLLFSKIPTLQSELKSQLKIKGI